MTIRFSRDAIADLQGISDYTRRQWGKEQEETYLKQIYAAFERIRQNPSQFRLRAELFDGCRTAPVGRHLVFFLVKDNILIVSRVLHQSMDFPRHQFPDW